MKKIKTIYLFIVLFIIVIPVFFLLLSLILRPYVPRTETTPEPTREITSSPTLGPQVKTFQVIRSSPRQSSDLFYLTFQPVEFLFSGVVIPENLKYTVEPFVKTSVRQGTVPNSLIITPAISWAEGRTKITVTQETKSTEGSALYPPFIYELNTSSPPIPDAEEGETY
ncbi:MAG: hypothetical protein A3C30_03815 [Candidatus Levybacteria bacterium RIFCSPHIGHO2_02_FULL_40_18]|nr:MAG: hypothetical protein A2869_00435 [Candidatus Levybacteria bacterium RIFCSPHIGHO2_01_FULL_40_58]OGH26212.1 MAG: hypothetical protein A3C30_03815 [Candidatus Levybacteria bacterium RIFCSPHIGHO2_02_FULL_40_18]OGH31464.1 MAG: hypothetical protein A3E43_02855 [Candidatus Levybacteria bacterium RIFCSPHIGHO2_12_FULL_40_31]OGH40104.1 MAG: hypothetical protein A2894_04175 [Candidatus Levybacteria bacterium RIFCSPLOWO2_01_FULL_40_64]OGH49056.1 MAG: hypothetical protein A3I54_00595 [Candidatus Lev